MYVRDNFLTKKGNIKYKEYKCLSLNTNLNLVLDLVVRVTILQIFFFYVYYLFYHLSRSWWISHKKNVTQLFGKINCIYNMLYIFIYI